MEDISFQVLRRIVDAAPDAILALDTEGRICFVNQPASDLLGWSRQELLAMRVDELIPGRLREAHFAKLADCLRHPAVRRTGEHISFVGLQRDGTEVPVDIMLSSLETARKTYTVAALRDVRPLKAIENSLRETTHEMAALNRRLQEAVEAKNRLLGVAAHDLRNPLASMQGFAAMLAAGSLGPLTEQQVEVVNRIGKSAEFMLQLVNELLDISAVDAGQMRLHETDAAVVDLVAGCCAMHQPIAERKSIRIELVSSITAPVARVDAAKLEQVVNNLLDNAIKFSPPGTGIAVAIESVGGDIVVSVTDEGPGISEAETKKLFQPFGRASTRPTGNERSTGLGLAIARRIMEEHGGAIWLESSPGRGAKFCFRIPAARLSLSEVEHVAS